MDIEGLFRSPRDRIATFAQMQLFLYRGDESLQDYFMQLQLDSLSGPIAISPHLRALDRFTAKAMRTADKISRFHARRRIKTDVLFCPLPYFERKTENRFLVRTLLGLAQTDAKILCLIPEDAPCRREVEFQLDAAGRKGQIKFIDPLEPSNPLEARLRPRLARMRAHFAFDKAVSLLEPHGLTLGQELETGFEHIAQFTEAWDRLAPSIEFDAVVARCHWHALCSPVCRTARQREKPVITFQQGVIGHTLDVPVTASKYLAFGAASALFLGQMNQRFFHACGAPEPSVEYVKGGSLFDRIVDLPDQFDHQALLMVDLPIAQADFYGVDSQSEALLQLAERLLRADLTLRRIIIRPHPYWSNLNFESCQRLAREYPGRCELSHPAWSLEDDLRRSSAAVGIFSGVLTVAAACGLPTYFLQTEQGYTTGDLACFSPRQTLLPDEAFREISKVLSDRQAYAEARSVALKNAREYYANGSDAELDGAFFERLLRSDPVIGPSKMGS